MGLQPRELNRATLASEVANLLDEAYRQVAPATLTRALDASRGHAT